MNSIYTAEFDENHPYPVTAYTNALCTYIHQLALDDTGAVAKVCSNIEKSYEYFVRKSSEGSWTNADKAVQALKEQNATNGTLKAKVKQLESDKDRADAKIAKLTKRVQLKEGIQLTANGRIFASQKVEKNRDYDDLNKKIEKLQDNVRQISERNTELQISKNSMEAVNEKQTKKIKQIEAESTKLKKELKQKEEKLKKTYISSERMRFNSTQLEKKIYGFSQKMEAKVSEINKLKEKIDEMKTRCRTYAGQLQIATQENFNLENQLEILSLYEPAYKEVRVEEPSDKQSEKEPLVKQVKEDNEQLKTEEEVHKEKAKDFVGEIDKNPIDLGCEENQIDFEDLKL
ncbi:hypothetical protein L3Y34_007368 [Caenorhabditis briggsae]|uniref:Uncharacterized protein n=1 Tax=Caenorhabditis briggsae TaxID=6238 RepID=A0AAE8ZZP8_CAEBR|nr:hypothetical protein L3Y34_007368 [Caenorhabditis briggsae]